VNTLKPLLIVAVLAGVGYGVYVRLNRGANAPPPPVAAGWDSAPAVELPSESGPAPWGPSAAPPVGAGPTNLPPTAAAPPAATSEAPPFQAPTSQAPGNAPPYQGSIAGPPGAGPPAAPAAPGGEAPPYPQPQTAPTDTAAEAAPPGAVAGPPAGSPYDPVPGTPQSAPPAPSPGASEAPPADPYADPNASSVPDRYRTQGPAAAPPAADNGQPVESAPAAGAAPSQGELPAPSGANPGEFNAALDSAKRELEGGQMATALRQLSTWYGKPGLTADETRQLNELLDQVAGTVVYSTQHLLEPPYEVQPGERLEDIGEKYSVPWELLAKINGIDDPAALRPGERLKVIRGPFQAVVSLESRELTILTNGGSYAGRFKIGIGSEHPPQEGTFAVSEKVANPVYYGRDRAIGAEDPANPLGERWIGLGKNLGIHGTNNPESIGRNDLAGSISLSQRDIEDVYDILSLGSRVTIRR
jgi:lipoprotein-anchoring transpeptidase ErfK/SrfK